MNRRYRLRMVVHERLSRLVVAFLDWRRRRHWRHLTYQEVLNDPIMRAALTPKSTTRQLPDGTYERTFEFRDGGTTVKGEQSAVTLRILVPMRLYIQRLPDGTVHHSYSNLRDNNPFKTAMDEATAALAMSDHAVQDLAKNVRSLGLPIRTTRHTYDGTQEDWGDCYHAKGDR